MLKLMDLVANQKLQDNAILCTSKPDFETFASERLSTQRITLFAHFYVIISEKLVVELLWMHNL